MLTYPPDFVAAVKAEFPDWPELHAALDAGDQIVGRYLGNSLGMRIDEAAIAEAIRDGRADEVLAEAERAARVRALDRRWWEMYDAHRRARAAAEAACPNIGGQLDGLPGIEAFIEAHRT